MFRNQLPYFTDELMLGQASSLIYERVDGLIESKIVQMLLHQVICLVHIVLDFSKIFRNIVEKVVSIHPKKQTTIIFADYSVHPRILGCKKVIPLTI